jgi:heme A synthase
VVSILNPLLAIHTFFVPLILLAGLLTLIVAIILLVQRRRLSDINVPLSQSSPTLARLFRWLLIVTAALGVLQAIVGGLIFLTGSRPFDSLHFVYGGIVLLAIPVAYAYSDQKRVRRDVIIMLIAAVAIIGAAVRAFMTGAPPAH